MNTLFRPGQVIRGSVYPGASPLQDLDYAARVRASKKKSPPEETAPEPSVAPLLKNAPARRRKERK